MSEGWRKSVYSLMQSLRPFGFFYLATLALRAITNIGLFLSIVFLQRAWQVVLAVLQGRVKALAIAGLVTKIVA